MKIYTELKENEKRLIEDYATSDEGVLAVFSKLPCGWNILGTVKDDIFIISNGNKKKSDKQNKAVLAMSFYDYTIVENIYPNLNYTETCDACYEYVCCIQNKVVRLMQNYERALERNYPEDALAKKRLAITKMISCYNLSADYYNREVEDIFGLFEMCPVDAA